MSKEYKVLISKKIYALMSVNAGSTDEAEANAKNDKFVSVEHNPEKFPDESYKIEKVLECK